MGMGSANPSIPTPIISIGIVPGIEFVCLVVESSGMKTSNGLILCYSIGIWLHGTLLCILTSMRDICGVHSNDSALVREPPGAAE